MTARSHKFSEKSVSIKFGDGILEIDDESALGALFALGCVMKTMDTSAENLHEICHTDERGFEILNDHIDACSDFLARGQFCIANAMTALLESQPDEAARFQRMTISWQGNPLFVSNPRSADGIAEIHAFLRELRTLVHGVNFFKAVFRAIAVQRGIDWPKNA